MAFACCVNVYGECAHEQHVRKTPTVTLTHTITAYSVSMVWFVCGWQMKLFDPLVTAL